MGLPYVYLGYWVEGSPRMQYKVRYRPMEKLGRTGWERMGTQEQDRLIAAAVANPRSSAKTVHTGGKDGLPSIAKV
jgi:arginine-tRNA-protein transferase